LSFDFGEFDPYLIQKNPFQLFLTAYGLKPVTGKGLLSFRRLSI
jgi:hypothetical protein